jgi:shikimate kinase
VVLVGFMGAGKSTVGPVLAQLLGWLFVDIDQKIEKDDGRKVAEIFAQDGEKAFREMEHAEAALLAERHHTVVAAGGGAFTVDATRAALQHNALTVWLRCDLDVLLSRLPADGSRPLAANRATIAPLLSSREPLYALADITVDTTRTSPDEVARAIADALRQRRGAGGTAAG